MRVVVVGSGFGGLAAAIRLAAAGHEVTVLEKRDGIGGRAYQYQMQGFRFDGGPTVLTAPFMFEELFALAGERLSDHVDLVPLDPFYRAFDADGRAFDYHASDTEMVAEVAARSPSDAAGFQRLGRRISGIFDAFYPYTERPMMQPQVMLAMLPYLLQHRAMLDVRRLVNSCVRDPFLRQALSFHPLLIGGDPARTPALYSLIVEFERRWGVHYAIGGTGALVDALGQLAEKLGARIVLGADVERILVEDGRAVGVQLADSSTYPADVVVSNADPGFTYESLLGLEPRARTARARMRQARPSMSLHVLYLGADRTWPDSPLVHHNMLFARDQRAAMRRVFPGPIARRSNRDPAGPQPTSDTFLYVHVPTRTDPSVAPPGCEALYVLVATPARPEPGTDPQQEQDRVRAAVVDLLDRQYLPGLADHIVVEHAIGPEHFRDVLNSPQGAAFSLQPTLFQSGWFRPHNRSRAVRGLYLVGAGTHPGAGVPAVLASGKIAAELIAAQMAGPGQLARSGRP
ncbi:MAG: phytoene desaturase family protein [Candidatus Nanopelagicales bacterium]|jgi:phytoene desaturase|nr:phytoene desaturase family protein [Candidatus Nanopelagicales bacterium]